MSEPAVSLWHYDRSTLIKGQRVASFSVKSTLAVMSKTLFLGGRFPTAKREVPNFDGVVEAIPLIAYCVVAIQLHLEDAVFHWVQSKRDVCLNKYKWRSRSVM